jgi:hypothetical protein
MLARISLIACLAATAVACTTTPEKPQLSYAETVRQRPMPTTDEERAQECKWIAGQIKRINNEVNRAQFTQTTKNARLARESAEQNIAVLKQRGRTLLCPV